MKRITFELDEALYEELRVEAFERHESVSAAIRRRISRTPGRGQSASDIHTPPAPAGYSSGDQEREAS